MAKSKFEYVKSFEILDKLPPMQWILLSLKNSKMSDALPLCAPGDIRNDVKLSSVLESCAHCVLNSVKDIKLGYGYASNFIFVFSRDTTLYQRRGSKLSSTVTSLMSSSASDIWSKSDLPPFTATLFEVDLFLFPYLHILRQYLCEKQRECHMYNLTQTVLWHLVNKGGYSESKALETVATASEADKNELLFSQFGLNYNNEPKRQKKGIVVLRQQAAGCLENGEVCSLCDDFSSDAFWHKKLFPHFSDNSEVCKRLSQREISLFQVKFPLLPHTWLVVRIDGKGYHRFASCHKFQKPNDMRSLKLMNEAARAVMGKIPAIILAYGQSDEYSFVTRKQRSQTEGYLLMNKVVSCFSEYFVNHWKKWFPAEDLKCYPVFDSRVILYPSDKCLRDYLSWRQADCHINNVYNTCFWNLIKKNNISAEQAHEVLKGTVSHEKLTILSDMGIDYSSEHSLYCKGTTIYRKDVSSVSGVDCQSALFSDVDNLEECTEDIIGDSFWESKSWLLEDD